MDKKFKLPKDFLTKWLEALRSGEYVQGTGQLYQYETYCCLGVAGVICDVSIERLQTGCFTYKDDFPEIPQELKTGLFYEGSDERYQIDLANECMRLNDTERKSFIEIADWLEQNVEDY